MSLKSACDNLEAAFVETENKLDKVTQKVDVAVAQVEDSKSVSGRGPSHLVQSLKEIRDEHASIVKQVEQLKETQSAFITDILKDLSKLQEAEAQLIAKVGGEETLNKE